MGVITISVDDDVESRFRAVVKRERGDMKGVLGGAITEAMQKWTGEQEQKEIAERALERLRKGYAMGGMLIKSRDEIYDRYDKHE